MPAHFSHEFSKFSSLMMCAELRCAAERSAYLRQLAHRSGLAKTFDVAFGSRYLEAKPLAGSCERQYVVVVLVLPFVRCCVLHVLCLGPSGVGGELQYHFAHFVVGDVAGLHRRIHVGLDGDDGVI